MLNFRKVMVQMVSAVSGHNFNLVKERLADKMELIKFDPWSELPEIGR
jgi:large subunit ribosomal protein L33